MEAWEDPTPLDEEPVEDEVLKDLPEGQTKGATDITFANATSKDVHVELYPLKLVMQRKIRAKNFAVGVNAGATEGGLNIEGGIGEAEMDVLEYSTTMHTVQSHKVMQMEVPPLDSGETGASLLVGSIYLKMYTEDKVTDKKEEIGKGWSVGPGQGLILTEFKEKIMVEPAKGRSFWRKFKAWEPKFNKGTRDPHHSLRFGDSCEDCGVTI